MRTPLPDPASSDVTRMLKQTATAPLFNPDPLLQSALVLTALCTHSLHLLCFVISLKALYSTDCISPSLTWTLARPRLCRVDLTTREGPITLHIV